MTKKVIIIPGNPYSKKLYLSWLQSLNDLHIADFTMLSPPDIREDEYSLISYSKEFQSLISEHIVTNKKITIIAHSVGCFFTHQLLELFKENIERVIYIFPYFGDENRKGRKLLNAMKFINSSKILRKLFLGSKPLLNLIVSDLEEITKKEASHALSLAALESVYFEKNNSDKLRFNGDIDFSIFYCDHDNWCTEKTIENLGRFLKLQHIQARHDFVLNKADIERVNEVISNLI